MSDKAKCADCGREREAGDKDYHPAQFILRESIGWYSGDDGEICGHCMAAFVRKVNWR